MAFGWQVIATGAVVWKRVLRIPPMRHGGASSGPGSIDPLRLRRPKMPLRDRRTGQPVPDMEFGWQVIATGAVVWKRALRIPPMRHGALSLGIAPEEASVGRTYGMARTDFGVWNCYWRCTLEAGALYTAHLACGQ